MSQGEAHRNLGVKNKQHLEMLKTRLSWGTSCRAEPGH